MQRSDRWPEEYDPATTSTSRRNSAESRRNSAESRRNSAETQRNSLKKEKDKRSPLNSSVSSTNSTPKKTRAQNVDLVVTGKQLLKKADRANSLPGGYQRRPSVESIKRRQDVKRTSQAAAKSRDTSLEDDVSLDLSQVSDFEDTSSKYGMTQKLVALATSTPKPRLGQKPRSASVNQPSTRLERLKSDSRNKSRDSMFSNSGDSLYKTSSSASNSTLRYGASTELDYSSVSPEYSGQSSADLSPRLSQSDRSQELHVSSCCISTCNDCTEAERTKVPELAEGEWSRFWQHYNLGLTGPRRYYDQCPTPYRNDTFDVGDLDLSSDSNRKRSPEDIKNINSIIRNEGLHLTPRETQNIIKCAHILGNVLTKAIERRSKEKDEYPDKIEEIPPEKMEKPENIDPESEVKKKSMTLDLKEPNIPMEVKVEKTCETVTTQTDISLPNTKSAPRIFESILRQLSRTTIEEKVEKQAVNKIMEDAKHGVVKEASEVKEDTAGDKPEGNKDSGVSADLEAKN